MEGLKGKETIAELCQREVCWVKIPIRSNSNPDPNPV
jgi:hypothetical protein